eukprot:1235850-Rhodomonas_salina.1
MPEYQAGRTKQLKRRVQAENDQDPRMKKKNEQTDIMDSEKTREGRDLMGNPTAVLRKQVRKAREQG